MGDGTSELEVGGTWQLALAKSNFGITHFMCHDILALSINFDLINEKKFIVQL